MRIGELAKASGVATSRIRFYETAGLIAPRDRTDAGYREYDEDAVQTLEIISHAQVAGFTLSEIRSLLPAPATDGEWDRARLLSALQGKDAAMEELQQRLRRARRQLRRVIADIESKPDDLPCTDNAERIMQQLRTSLAAAGPRAQGG